MGVVKEEGDGDVGAAEERAAGLCWFPRCEALKRGGESSAWMEGSGGGGERGELLSKNTSGKGTGLGKMARRV